MFAVVAARASRKVVSRSITARWTARGALGFSPIVSSVLSHVAAVREFGAMPHAHRWARPSFVIARAAGARGEGGGRGGRGGRGGTGTRVRPRRGRPDEGTAPPSERRPMSTSSAPKVASKPKVANEPNKVPSTGNAPTTVAFADLDLCDESLRALHEVKGYRNATEVQDAVLPHIMAGKDVLARAKTGSGKTIAFLLPVLEKLKRTPPERRGGISALVLSPTRELATQIQEECKQLLTFRRDINAQVVFGGTNIRTDVSRLKSENPDILVATPGRLIDHLENGDVSQRLRSCDTLVFDEADRLLDMGFKPAIEKILRHVPAGRQTLLFSATVSPEIQQVAKQSLRPGHVFVDCVGEEESATNLQVKQSLISAAQVDQFAVLKSILDEHCAKTPNHKVMCFFTTARATQLAAELFQRMRPDVIEIHSKLSQSRRTKATDQFRDAARAVMMTSDVTARGIDFPDVSLVVQIGAPSDRAQYIHRLGRTARAGKSGEGVLVLAPEEDYFARDDVRDLPLAKATPKHGDDDAAAVAAAMRSVDDRTKAQHYAAELGYRKGLLRKMGWNAERLVREANAYAVDFMGCREPPPMLKKTVGKMGLKGVPGLNVVSQLPGSDAGTGKDRKGPERTGKPGGPGGGGGRGQRGGFERGGPPPRGSGGGRGRGSGRGGRGGRGGSRHH